MSADGPAEATVRCACGQVLPSDAQWCWLCQQRLPEAGDPRFAADTDLEQQALRPVGRTSQGTVLGTGHRVGRLTRSEVTFGPVGRIVCTILVLLPIPFLLFATSFGIGLVGFAVYTFVLTPWALRDLWRRHR